MMSLTFGLFTQVSGSGPLGPLVILESTKMKIVEVANSVDLDEVVHNEPSHLDVHC